MAKKKRKPHIVLWLVILVLFVPCVIAGAVLWSTLEDSSQPVVAKRFDNELNPAITETQLEALKTSLQDERIESVQVNCISATVRILINTTDEVTQWEIEELVSKAYTTVNEQLPIDTYFTNTDSTKMYDLEIHVYNVMQGDNKIYYVCTKTAGAENYVTDNVALPKNQEISDAILNPPAEENGGELE